MADKRTILVVDDDEDVRESLCALLESAGFAAKQFDSATRFLAEYASGSGDCLIVDVRMPDMDGLQLQEELRKRGLSLPVIIVTGHGDVPLAVRAMKAGALDFIEKPFDDNVLLASVRRGIAEASAEGGEAEAARLAKERIASLTPRERQVLEQLVLGQPNKVIAYTLDISPRTVEIHRAHLMDKMEARSLSDVVRQALIAGVAPEEA